MNRASIFTAAVALLLRGFVLIAEAGEPELQEMMANMETKVREIASAAEQWQSRRCDSTVVGRSACGNTNYHCCGSKLPRPVCPAGSQNPECGAACGQIRDFSTSVVSLHGVNEAGQGQLSDLTKETVCWSRKLDETFLAHATEFDDTLDASEFPTMYFGSEDVGMMRQVS
eukprot:SAG31_NODE_3801_length_3870_cov_1.727658_3_plen_171_part_00